MVAFNFSAKYAPQILSGEKYSTIRPTKRCKAGDKLQLYTGMRTKRVKLLKVAECVLVEKIQIFKDRIEGVEMEEQELLEILGFPHYNFEEFIRYFEKEYGLPCTGYLVIWKDLSRE